MEIIPLVEPYKEWEEQFGEGLLKAMRERVNRKVELLDSFLKANGVTLENAHTYQLSQNYQTINQDIEHYLLYQNGFYLDEMFYINPKQKGDTYE